MSSRGWIGVDLDGTLAVYDTFKGPLEIGAPIPLMVERVKAWLAKGRSVKIFTARVAATDVNDFEIANAIGHARSMGALMDREQAIFHLENWNRMVPEIIEAIQDWCELHVGERLPVTNKKDFAMIELWDDRAVQVVPNTGERVGP